METKKIILTIVGLAALVIPVILLIIFTKRDIEPAGSIPSENRNINPQTVEEAVSKYPSPTPVIIPSPSPSPEEQVDLGLEGSPSAE